LQVAEEDFLSAMNWGAAKKACKNLGNGWRLPSLEELEAMHEQLHKQGKGNFKTDNPCENWYWSSEELSVLVAWNYSFCFWSEWDVAWGQEETSPTEPSRNNGYDGLADISDKCFGKNVRAVRDLP